MKNKYYDNWKTKKIFNDYTKDIILAKEEIEDCLKDYPKDYSMYCYYASILVTLGNLAQAKEIIDKIEYLMQNDYDFFKINNSYKTFKRNFFYSKLRYLIYSGQYQAFINLYLKQKKDFNINLDSCEFYCRGQMNLLSKNKREPNSYLFRQIVDYQENDFLKHIEKHQADYNDIDKPNSSIFVPDFPIRNVIDETKKYIMGETKLNSGFIENMYIFKYDNCGKIKNKNTDYFKIISFNNTSDYITMCPMGNGQFMPYTNLNYLKDENMPMIRKLSQIDKFNQKYNL
jgi:hypothetical protein